MPWMKLLEWFATNTARNALSVAALSFAVYQGTRVRLMLVGDVYEGTDRNKYLNSNGTWHCNVMNRLVPVPGNRLAVNVVHIGRLYVDENGHYHYQHDQGVISLGK